MPYSKGYYILIVLGILNLALRSPGISRPIAGLIPFTFGRKPNGATVIPLRQTIL